MKLIIFEGGLSTWIPLYLLDVDAEMRCMRAREDKRVCDVGNRNDVDITQVIPIIIKMVFYSNWPALGPRVDIIHLPRHPEHREPSTQFSDQYLVRTLLIWRRWRRKRCRGNYARISLYR